MDKKILYDPFKITYVELIENKPLYKLKLIKKKGDRKYFFKIPTFFKYKENIYCDESLKDYYILSHFTESDLNTFKQISHIEYKDDYIYIYEKTIKIKVNFINGKEVYLEFDSKEEALEEMEKLSKLKTLEVL